MKKITLLSALLIAALLLTGLSNVSAEIIPPHGEGQIGLQAAVLCEKLTLREKPNASSRALKSLQYRDLIIVTEQKDGWARCVLGDSEDALSGWVNSEYIVIDPAWYRTEEKTPVYAWNDTAAPKVAMLEANTVLLDKDTYLPILKDEGDWLIVSLRGATGWIHVEGRSDLIDRHEGVITIEGMEETVQYERIRSESIGFEMDYDYERFARRSEEGRECFVSRYDDPTAPENYLEITLSPLGAEEAAASVSEELSGEYELYVGSRMLAGAGSCIYIDASAAVGGKYMPDKLQAVYIIPAGEGSIVAWAHYEIEAAEGLGVRFDAMLDTLTVTN